MPGANELTPDTLHGWLDERQHNRIDHKMMYYKFRLLWIKSCNNVGTLDVRGVLSGAFW